MRSDLLKYDQLNVEKCSDNPSLSNPTIVLDVIDALKVLPDNIRYGSLGICANLDKFLVRTMGFREHDAHHCSYTLVLDSTGHSYPIRSSSNTPWVGDQLDARRQLIDDLIEMLEGLHMPAPETDGEV